MTTPIIEDQVKKKLVDQCLDNWLGYGNPNGKVWFIGTEEGGAEIWRSFKTQSLESSLVIRKDFKLQMDFVDVWEQLYQIPLSNFKGPSVWSFIAAFILEFGNQAADPKSVKEYIFTNKCLGRPHSDHFLCEFLPLPKRKKNEIEPYKMIWETVAVYRAKVEESRFEKILRTIKSNANVKLLVSYEGTLSAKLSKMFEREGIEELESFGNARNESSKKYSIHKIQISPQRDILLLKTPFFGNGCISYGDISKAVQKIKEYI